MPAESAPCMGAGPLLTSYDILSRTGIVLFGGIMGVTEPASHLSSSHTRVCVGSSPRQNRGDTLDTSGLFRSGPQEAVGGCITIGPPLWAAGRSHATPLKDWHMLGDCPLRAEAAGCSSTDSQPSLAAGSFVRGPLELLCARLGSPLHGEICEQGTVALELRVLPYTPSCFFRSLEARSPT